MSSLFRKSVIHNLSNQRLGNIILSSPFSTLFLTIFFVLIGFTLFFLVMFAEYSRKERVIGYLSPESGLVRIVPRHSGFLKEIYVNSGQNVRTGDKLFSITVDILNSQGINRSEAQLQQIELQQIEIKKILLNNIKYVEKSKSRLERQIKFSAEESKRLSSRIDLQTRRVENEFTLLSKLTKLSQEGLSSSLDVASQENSHVEVLQGLHLLKNEYQRQLENTKDLKEQLQLLAISAERDKSEMKQELLALEQRRLDMLSEGTVVIAAPISGELVSLTANIGQNVNSQKALATIVPKGNELVAKLLIPSRAAGQIKEGQTVRLLYDAFPYQKFGFQSGIVENVSRSVISTQDLEIAPKLMEPVFLINVKLNSQRINTGDGQFPLQPGMTLSADIILEQRYVWEWLLEPLLKVLNG